jgi:hypothetical protein
MISNAIKSRQQQVQQELDEKRKKYKDIKKATVSSLKVVNIQEGGEDFHTGLTMGRKTVCGYVSTKKPKLYAYY